MKIAILSQDPALYSTRRLREAGEAQEHDMRVINYLRCYMNILVQEYIKEAQGADLRCFLIGGKVIAAIKRQGADGEFRSNLHRGGKATKVKLTPEERSTAIRAAKAMGLRVAGVDLLRSNHGPVVMEVNSSPGLEGIEKVTEIDVAGQIIEYIAKNATPGSTRDRIKY